MNVKMVIGVTRLLPKGTTAFAVAAMLVLYGVVPAAHAHGESVVRAAILSSQQLGAHGFGYGNRSLDRMSRMLSPKDIPALLRLYAGQENLRVGVQFALASLCRAGLDGTMQAVREGTFHYAGEFVDFMGAESTAHLISTFDGCDAQTKQMAKASIAEINRIRDAAYAKRAQEIEKRRAEDARVQANGLRLLIEGSSTSLTKAEREEVFARSLKAAGLDGPRTPEQEQMVQRMYKGMVLNKAPASHGNNSPSQ